MRWQYILAFILLVFLLCWRYGYPGAMEIEGADFSGSAWDYRYQLIINLTGAKIANHTLQPVTLNISSLNGTNIPALAVAFNNSGTWEEVPWEWFHQRGDAARVNDTIRFRVNVFNNTLQRDYWIFTTDNGSMPPRNVSLFLLYDGFEVGNVDGWVNETGVHFEATDRRSANGDWCGNKSDDTCYYEAYYDFPFNLDDKANITICWFARWETNVSINLPYLLQNVTGTYTTKRKDNVLETWFFNEGRPTVLKDGRPSPTQTMRMYDNNTIYILDSFLFRTWYAWCYKDINTTGDEINSDFWVDGKLNYSDVDGWRYRNGSVFAAVDTIDGISLANSANSRNKLSEAYIDEVYVSLGYDYNIYEAVPEIRIDTGIADNFTITTTTSTTSTSTTSTSTTSTSTTSTSTTSTSTTSTSTTSTTSTSTSSTSTTLTSTTSTTTTSTTTSTTSTTTTVIYLKGDANGDGVVSDFELLDYIDEWADGLVGDPDLLDAVDNWASG